MVKSLRKRCVRPCASFSVFVHMPWSPQLNLGSLLQPPPGVTLANRPEEACLIMVPVNRPANSFYPKWTVAANIPLQNMSSLPGWNGGVNHVLLNLHDQPLDRREKHLGCAMVAQSHADQNKHALGFDISMPLLSWNQPADSTADRPRRDAQFAQLQQLAIVPPMARAYFISFKGQQYYGRQFGREGFQRAYLSQLQSKANRTKPNEVLVALRCGSKEYSEHQEHCDRLQQRFDASPDYAQVFNTTLALAPLGVSPASFRLHEILAAGAIPVFFSGELYTGSPYIPPFEDVIPWSELSFHFPDSPSSARSLVSRLESIHDSKLIKMHELVNTIHTRHFSTELRSRQTFYQILQSRVSSVSRETKGRSKEKKLG